VIPDFQQLFTSWDLNARPPRETAQIVQLVFSFLAPELTDAVPAMPLYSQCRLENIEKSK
jgi:hypothetical protein